jgi:molecular chaperone DnaK (HSP70)
MLSVHLGHTSMCRCEVDPEQAVALGAAIQAAVLLGLSSGLELMDGSYVEGQHNRSTGIQ